MKKRFSILAEIKTGLEEELSKFRDRKTENDLEPVLQLKVPSLPPTIRNDDFAIDLTLIK